MNTASTKQSEWDKSYENRDNFVSVPSNAEECRILDLGCGIGRHVMYFHEMGLNAYGIDLSDVAIRTALDWAQQQRLPEPEKRILQGDIRALPWSDGFFHYAVSHGVLDSMPFKIAREACVELARVMPVGGLFYCDLISGDDSGHAREFSGEQVVSSVHEQGTIQLYFNLAKILSLIEGVFEIAECNLIRRENVLKGGYSSRYHLILRRN